MKWQVNFVNESGIRVHTAYVEAKSKAEACRKMEKDVDVKKSLQIALGGKEVSCDFYIFPANTLN